MTNQDSSRSDDGFVSGKNRPSPTQPQLPAAPGEATAWHRGTGILLLAGPAFRTQATLLNPTMYDRAPTELALDGIAPLAAMAGRVLTEARAVPPAN